MNERYSYYPKERPFNEMTVRYYADLLKPIELLRFMKLKYLIKKLKLKYPDFVVDEHCFLGVKHIHAITLNTIIDTKDLNKMYKIRDILVNIVDYEDCIIHVVNCDENTNLKKIILKENGQKINKIKR